MNLFVDSNIFLNFYHFSNDDLEELKKLATLIEKQDIKLFITKQVTYEVKRNRDNVVSKAYKEFCNSKLEISIPQICKTYSEYEMIKSSLSSIRQAKSDLITKLKSDITDRSLNADKIIEQLFGLAEIVESDSYIEFAKVRFDLGNPPGKDKSYGDAVNWESLLNCIPEKEDLFFISDDRDYKSPLIDGGFNSFLKDEWYSKKKSILYFYVQLSTFFLEHHADIKLKVEEEKDSLIENLSRCSSFSRTHTLISKLSQFDGFSETQISDLIEAGISNSQIYLIHEDKDIKSFFNTLLQGKVDFIEPIVLTKFNAKFKGVESSTNQTTKIEQKDTMVDDDLPF